jgi:D-aminopeptidase
MKKTLSAFLVLLLVAQASLAQQKPRARNLGIPFDGTTGPLNAITDVTGVGVGHTTLITGNGSLKVGTGPIRTGVTAILPRGRHSDAPVFAAWFALNGTGEMTGTTFIDEYGFLEGPVMLTNSQSVGTVRDAVSSWLVNQKKWPLCCLPVVAETYDGDLNDINGFHVKAQHVLAAINSAGSGPVAEGNVGGGTGMIAYGFKGGIGTASRKLDQRSGGYTVGVLVQANMGRRSQLTIAGVPVGREIAGDLPVVKVPDSSNRDTGSIIIIIATDAPLLPHQLKRMARRAALGLARTGSIAGDSSGDIFLAFSTANEGLVGLQTGKPSATTQVAMLPNDQMNPLFEATVQATEEAIINALIAAETMVGIDNHRVTAIRHDRLREVLKKYNRLND